MTAPSRLRLALVAHDAKKADMADFVAAHIEVMRRLDLYATGTMKAAGPPMTQSR